MMPEKPDLLTRTGYRFHVRPVVPDDATPLASLMANISHEDVRFRFPNDGDRAMKRMTRIDHDRTESFVAIGEDGSMIATAMLAADASGKEAEVAIATRSDCRHRGVGWTLLHYLVGYARQHGLESLLSTQSRDDRTVIDLEREMGFVTTPYPGDPTRVLLRMRFTND